MRYSTEESRGIQQGESVHNAGINSVSTVNPIHPIDSRLRKQNRKYEKRLRRQNKAKSKRTCTIVVFSLSIFFSFCIVLGLYLIDTHHGIGVFKTNDRMIREDRGERRIAIEEQNTFIVSKTANAKEAFKNAEEVLLQQKKLSKDADKQLDQVADITPKMEEAHVVARNAIGVAKALQKTFDVLNKKTNDAKTAYETAVRKIKMIEAELTFIKDKYTATHRLKADKIKWTNSKNLLNKKYLEALKVSRLKSTELKTATRAANKAKSDYMDTWKNSRKILQASYVANLALKANEEKALDFVNQCLNNLNESIFRLDYIRNNNEQQRNLIKEQKARCTKLKNELMNETLGRTEENTSNITNRVDRYTQIYNDKVHTEKELNVAFLSALKVSAKADQMIKDALEQNSLTSNAEKKGKGKAEAKENPDTETKTIVKDSNNKKMQEDTLTLLKGAFDKTQEAIKEFEKISHLRDSVLKKNISLNKAADLAKLAEHQRLMLGLQKAKSKNVVASNEKRVLTESLKSKQTIFTNFQRHTQEKLKEFISDLVKHKGNEAALERIHFAYAEYKKHRAKGFKIVNEDLQKAKDLLMTQSLDVESAKDNLRAIHATIDVLKFTPSVYYVGNRQKHTGAFLQNEAYDFALEAKMAYDTLLLSVKDSKEKATIAFKSGAISAKDSNYSSFSSKVNLWIFKLNTMQALISRYKLRYDSYKVVDTVLLARDSGLRVLSERSRLLPSWLHGYHKLRRFARSTRNENLALGSSNVADTILRHVKESSILLSKGGRDTDFLKAYKDFENVSKIVLDQSNRTYYNVKDKTKRTVEEAEKSAEASALARSFNVFKDSQNYPAFIESIANAKNFLDETVKMMDLTKRIRTEQKRWTECADFISVNMRILTIMENPMVQKSSIVAFTKTLKLLQNQNLIVRKSLQQYERLTTDVIKGKTKSKGVLSKMKLDLRTVNSIRVKNILFSKNLSKDAILPLQKNMLATYRNTQELKERVLHNTTHMERISDVRNISVIIANSNYSKMTETLNTTNVHVKHSEFCQSDFTEEECEKRAKREGQPYLGTTKCNGKHCAPPGCYMYNSDFMDTFNPNDVNFFSGKSGYYFSTSNNESSGDCSIGNSCVCKESRIGLTNTSSRSDTCETSVTEKECKDFAESQGYNYVGQTACQEPDCAPSGCYKYDENLAKTAGTLSIHGAYSGYYWNNGYLNNGRRYNSKCTKERQCYCLTSSFSARIVKGFTLFDDTNVTSTFDTQRPDADGVNTGNNRARRVLRKKLH